jgi:Zn-finger nucleic acid-binding protein
MICPKCQNNMEAIEYDGIEVDRCKSCHGIWFDLGESDWLRDKDAANSLDIGDPATGREKNEIDSYRCPRCNGGMMHSVDPKQPHIQIEECTSCRGSFFDAGEFSDLTEISVAALLKKWRAGKG